MADAGKPVPSEKIHAIDMNEFVTSVVNETRDYYSIDGDLLGTQTTCIAKTFSDKGNVIYTSADNMEVAVNSDLIEKKCLVGALAKKADLTNTSQTIQANGLYIKDGFGYVTASGAQTVVYAPGMGWIGPINKNLSIASSDGFGAGTATSLNTSSQNYTLKLPSTITADITGNVSGSSGSCKGNAATATKLGTAIQLKTTDGTNTSTGVSFDGSAGVSIKLPSKINATTFTGTLAGNATTATAIGDDFGFHQRANTESSSTTATFKVTPNKAYLLFQTHSNHYGVYLISTYAKGYATILDNNDGLTGLSVNNSGNQITVTSSAGRLSLIMVGRNT